MVARPPVRISVAPMTTEDVPAVHAIESASFPTPWPPYAFRQEIETNRMAHYLVVRAGSRVIAYAGIWLMVDEAHGTLVFGEKGAGVCEKEGISSRVDIQMGTLSKAFGSQGGYIASSEKLKSWLLNRGRPYVFSTALPVPVVAASLAALETNRTEPEIREGLWRWVELLGERLGRRFDSPIIPILVGENEATLDASQKLLEAGFHVPGIRPPTVPQGTARLRIALSSAHEEEDIHRLADCLGALEL